MSEVQRIRRLWLGVGFSLATFGGCRYSQTAPSDDCVAGDVIRCEGADGCMGEQECGRAGNYGDCACAEPVPEEEETVEAEPEPEALGAACNSDEDCPSTAFCLTRESTLWLGGAPAEGLCVANCSLDPGLCDKFSNARCVAASSSEVDVASGIKLALCLPSCEPDSGTLAEPACGSAAGTICEPLEDSGSGFCRPVCSFDEDCGEGFCDRQKSVCVEEATSYLGAFGSSCTVDEDTCDGVCLELSPGNAVCSERCPFGATSLDCATADASSVSAICGYAAPGSGLGDLGYCAEMCDCDADCSHPDFVCDPFKSADMQNGLGFVGLCAPPIDSEGQPVEGKACP